jgi:hypothetical protein
MAQFYMYRSHKGEAQNHSSNYAGYAIAKHNINEMQRQTLQTSRENDPSPSRRVWNNALKQSWP